MQTKVFPFWGLIENAEKGIDSLFLFSLNAIFLSLSLYFSRFPRSLLIPLLLVTLSQLQLSSFSPQLSQFFMAYLSRLMLKEKVLQVLVFGGSILVGVLGLKEKGLCPKDGRVIGVEKIEGLKIGWKSEKCCQFVFIFYDLFSNIFKGAYQLVTPLLLSICWACFPLIHLKYSSLASISSLFFFTSSLFISVFTSFFPLSLLFFSSQALILWNSAMSFNVIGAIAALLVFFGISSGSCCSYFICGRGRGCLIGCGG